MIKLNPSRWIIFLFILILLVGCDEEVPIKKITEDSWVYPNCTVDNFPLHEWHQYTKEDIPIATLSMYFKTILMNFNTHQDNLPTEIDFHYNYPRFEFLKAFMQTDEICLDNDVNNHLSDLSHKDIYYTAAGFVEHDRFYGKNRKNLGRGFSAYGASWGDDIYGRPFYRTWGTDFSRGARDMFKIVSFSTRIHSRMRIYTSDYEFFHEARGAILVFDRFGSDWLRWGAESNYFVFAYGARCIENDIFSFEQDVAVYVADADLEVDDKLRTRIVDYRHLILFEPKAIIYDRGVEYHTKILGIDRRMK